MVVKVPRGSLILIEIFIDNQKPIEKVRSYLKITKRRFSVDHPRTSLEVWKLLVVHLPPLFCSPSGRRTKNFRMIKWAYFTEARFDTRVNLETLLIFRWESANKLRFEGTKFVQTLLSSQSTCGNLLNFNLIEAYDTKVVNECVCLL